MALSKGYEIKWKKSDYITLGKAVSQFNKKINELNREEQKSYLPELQSYKEVKENITTRNELKRVINSLKKFQKQGSEDVFRFESGKQITKWEYQQLQSMRRTATKRLNQEYQELQKPNLQGFSRLQMGSQRAREIQDTLRSINKLEEKTGYEFERISRRIKMLGTYDYTLKKAYVFQENFLEQLQDLAKNDDSFQKVFDYFKDIKNPITFFNTTQKSQALQDFFEWYKTPENYAGFATTDELAEYILKEYRE